MYRVAKKCTLKYLMNVCPLQELGVKGPPDPHVSN